MPKPFLGRFSNGHAGFRGVGDGPTTSIGEDRGQGRLGRLPRVVAARGLAYVLRSGPEALLYLLRPEPVLDVPLRATFPLDSEYVARGVGSLILLGASPPMPRPRASYRRGGIYVVT